MRVNRESDPVSEETTIAADSASTTTEHIGDNFGVTVRYEIHQPPVAVDFYAAEVTSVSDDGAKYYLRKGARSSEDDTSDFDDAERYISGSVKWDGCSHYYFGDVGSEGGYVHLCSSQSAEKLARTIIVIHARCGELMRAAGQKTLEGTFANDNHT